MNKTIPTYSFRLIAAAVIFLSTGFLYETFGQCGTQGLTANPNISQGCAQQIAYSFSSGGQQIVSSPSWNLIPQQSGTLSSTSGTSTTVTWISTGTVRITYAVLENGSVVQRCSEKTFNISAFDAGTVSGVNSICSGSNVTLTVSGAQNASGLIWEQCTSDCGNGASWSTASGTVSGNDLIVSGVTTTTRYRTKLTWASCGGGIDYSNEKEVVVNPVTNIHVTINDPGPQCGNNFAGLVFSVQPGSNVGSLSTSTLHWIRNGNDQQDPDGPGDSNSDPLVYDPFDGTHGWQEGETIQLKVTSSNVCDNPTEAFSNTVTIQRRTETFPTLNSIQRSANPICSGTQITFNVSTSTSGGNISGNWSVGTGGSGGGLPFSGTSYTINTDVLATPSSNMVFFSGSVTGTCGTTQAVSTSTGALTVNPTRNPSILLSGMTMCQGSTAQITATPVDIGSFTVNYNWYINDVFKTQNSTGVFNPGTIANGDNVKVVMNITNPVCSPSSAQKIQQFTITPSSTLNVVINNPGAICNSSAAGLVFHLIQASSVVGTNPTYHWIRNGNDQQEMNGPGDTTPTDPLVYDPNDATHGFQIGETIRLKVTSSNACDSNNPAYSTLVTITAQPETFPSLNSIQISPNPICGGVPINFKINTSTSSTFISGNWKVGAGGFPSTTSSYTLNADDLISGTDVVNFSGTVTGTCGTAQAVSASTGILTIHPKPVAFSDDDALCSGETAMIELTSDVPGTTYTWTASYNNVSGAALSGSGALIQQQLTTTTGSAGTATYTVVPTSPAQCIGDPIVAVALVQPHPINPTLSQAQFCEFEPVILSAVPAGDIVTFQWYDNNNTYLGKGPSHRVAILPSGNYNYKFKSVSRIGCVSISYGTFNANVISTGCDDNMNWIETITYNPVNPIDPEVTGNTKSYYDPAGQLLQAQAKDIVSGRISISQSLADQLGRTAISTLTAPTDMASFLYKHWFVTDENGALYHYDKFDDPVNASSHEKSGWYYSESNNIEQHIPVTAYPYTRIDFYNDGSGEVRRSAKPGEQHKLGAGHELWSGTFPVFSELNDYLNKYEAVFPNLNQATSLRDGAVQTVSRDENGKFAIAISEKNGNTLMTCRAGTLNDHVLAITNSLTLSGDSTETATYRRATYFYLTDKTAVNITGSTDFVAEDLISEMKKDPGVTFAGPDGKWPAGFYRILLDKKDSEITLTYTNYFADVSYQFYDIYGTVLASISPNGYQKWKAEPTNYALIDKTTYSYNYRGFLLEMNEPDAGKTSYKYRRDGKIRFSQNALQKGNESVIGKGKFSYTHYDALGRPVESGEYTGQNYSFAGLEGQLEFAQQIDFGPSKTDWTKTTYDVPDGSIPNVPFTLTQEFVRGAVSFTENANIKTWYSYDEAGRVKWMAQKPAQLDRTFVTEYTYGTIGQLLQVHNVSYINTSPSDHFYHHYEYAADMRLSKSYTSTDGSDKKLRATYVYYLHGPLKRVELGDRIQGIDFVYNIQGWLTQINHPDKMQDPGEDTNDAFGMVLDYYESAMDDLFPVSVDPMGLTDPSKIHRLPLSGNHSATMHAGEKNNEVRYGSYPHKQWLEQTFNRVNHTN